MAWDVHLSVTFACDENDGVAELARNHFHLLLPVSGCVPVEAQWFLSDLAGRKGRNPGPKGGVSTWGIVGNYTQGRDFVDSLAPFWIDLLRGVPGGPGEYEHVIVFEEQEQSSKPRAYEIGFSDPHNEKGPQGFFIKEHDLPFSWEQA